MREGGGKKRESKEFPALDLSLELGFPKGEVCVCLAVYLQRFSRSPSTLPLQSSPCEWKHTSAHYIYSSILSNWKHTHINLTLFPQLRLMTAIKETDDQHNTQLIN